MPIRRRACEGSHQSKDDNTRNQKDLPSFSFFLFFPPCFHAVCSCMQASNTKPQENKTRVLCFHLAKISQANRGYSHKSPKRFFKEKVFYKLLCFLSLYYSPSTQHGVGPKNYQNMIQMVLSMLGELEMRRIYIYACDVEKSFILVVQTLYY